MQTRIEVGILGATGMVGQHFIKFLQGNPWFDLTWLGASDRSAGKKYKDAMTWHLAGGAIAGSEPLEVEPRVPLQELDKVLAHHAGGAENAYFDSRLHNSFTIR